MGVGAWKSLKPHIKHNCPCITAYRLKMPSDILRGPYIRTNSHLKTGLKCIQATHRQNKSQNIRWAWCMRATHMQSNMTMGDWREPSLPRATRGVLCGPPWHKTGCYHCMLEELNAGSIHWVQCCKLHCWTIVLERAWQRASSNDILSLASPGKVPFLHQKQ